MNKLQQALLAPFLNEAGGWPGIDLLPERLVQRYLAHPGPKALLSRSNPTLTLTNVRGGYRVYDQQMNFRYAVGIDPAQEALYADGGDSVMVPEFPVGLHPQDIAFIQALRPGQWFYLSWEAYDEESGLYRQLVGLIGISAADSAEVRQLEQQSQQVLKTWSAR